MASKNKVGIWEQIHNTGFNYGEFATIKTMEQK